MLVPGLTHLEATAIQVTLVGKPLLIIAVYLSPFRLPRGIASRDGWRTQRQTRGLDLVPEHETVENPN